VKDRSGKIASVLNNLLCETFVSKILTFCMYRNVCKTKLLPLEEGSLRGRNTLRSQFRGTCDVSSFIGQHTLDSSLNPSVFALNVAAKRTSSRLASHANKTRSFLRPPRQQPADFLNHFRRSFFRAYTCDRLFVDGSGYLHIGFATISFLSRVILSLCKHVKS